MAWVTPWTATTGQIVTAAQMNQVRDNLRYLKGLDGTVVIEADYTIEKAGANGPAVRAKNLQAGATFAALLEFMDSTNAVRGQITAFGNGGLRLSGPTSGAVGFQVIFSASGIGATSVTVVPAGVSRRYYLTGIAYNTTAGAGNSVNSGQHHTGVIDLYSDGGSNILRASVSSGVLSVARVAGSQSYDVILSVWYM